MNPITGRSTCFPVSSSFTVRLPGTSSTARPSASASFTGTPGFQSFAGRSRANDRTFRPFTATMASPRRRPACAAGPPGSTEATNVETFGSAIRMRRSPPAQVGTADSSTGS